MLQNRRHSQILLPLAAIALLLAAAAAPAQPAITEYTIEAAGATGIAAGLSGQVWFANPANAFGATKHTIGTVTLAGATSGYKAAPPPPASQDWATGPIAALGTTILWAAGNDNIFEITGPGPTITPLPLDHSLGGHSIDSIGYDGASSVWFTEVWGGVRRLGRLDVGGLVFQEGALPPECSTPAGFGRDMTRGSDGNMWFTAAGHVCRIDRTFAVTSQAIQNLAGGITSGSDSRIWLGGYNGNGFLLAFAPAGCPGANCHIDSYPLPLPVHDLHGLAAGPDGRIWFVSRGGQDLVGSVKTDGSDFQFLPLPTAGSQPEKITAGPPGDNSVWFTESGANRIGRVTGLAATTALFLEAGRFKVEVTWAVPPQGTSGVGNPVPIAPDTGAFWFFSPNNLELMIKVLDGRAINGHWWVFFGALSNVEYTITVTDLSTGAIWTYHNPFGTLASTTDTTAFATIEPPPQQARAAAHEVRPPFAGFDPVDLVRAELASLPAASTEVAQTACTPDATSLCLTASRFKVQVAWSVPSQGRSGVGTAAALTGDTGDFWFFSSNNLELIIKVLDARGVNNHFWVFYGALSNVEYTITITDTQTGAVKIYHNPDQTLASVADTSAF